MSSNSDCSTSHPLPFPATNTAYESVPIGVPVNARAIAGTVAVEPTEKIVVEVVAGFGGTQDGIPGNREGRAVEPARDDRENNFRMFLEPRPESGDRGLHASIRIENSSVFVNVKPSHDSSPSIRAQSCAMCDNSNPTDRKQKSVEAVRSPSVAIPDTTSRGRSA